MLDVTPSTNLSCTIKACYTIVSVTVFFHKYAIVLHNAQCAHQTMYTTGLTSHWLHTSANTIQNNLQLWHLQLQPQETDLTLDTSN